MSAELSGGRGKALLLFPTSFYSFASVVEKAISKIGYDVVLANDEYPANVFGKILGKLGMFWLLSCITDRVLCRRCLLKERYDLVLIVKGRGMGRRLLRRFREAGSRIVAYNFDSFAYNPAPLHWYQYVDKYCTFDYIDSQKCSLPLVELFSSLPIDDEPKRIVYDISAIMRNHSNRLMYLDAVLKLLPGERTFIYIFEQNAFYFIANFVRNPILYAKFWRYIHFKALPYQDYVAALKKSDFTLDYAHPKQSGITVRCFEALSAQTKIISNNSFVRYNARFNDSNAVIFDGKAGSKDAKSRYKMLKRSTTAKYHRTVSDFMDDLLA
jgi:hypothetical protein